MFFLFMLFLLEIFPLLEYTIYMRRYVKKQIILTVIISSCFMVVGLILGFMLFGNKAKEAEITLETLQNQIDVLENRLYGFNSDESIDIAYKENIHPIVNFQDYTQDEIQNIRIYEQAAPAVVNITTEVMGVNWFLEAMPHEGGSGSGSIIDERGYVVTNVHVIEDAYRIYISLSDGTQYEGEVIGTDTASDLAVLKFDPPPGVELTTIDFASSDNLVVGQKVIAIGNPFGFERTMTTGIVSALGRPIQTSNQTIIRDMIQTDTSINPGNSGGPLLDTQGRMIGVNTIIYSSSGVSSGIGFAVPIDTAKRVVADLIEHGVVQRGVLDPNSRLVQVTRSIASYANLSTTGGLLISELTENGSAEQAGLRAGTEGVRYGSGRSAVIIYLGGDVITGIDGEPIVTFADYYSLLESKKPGDIVTVDIMRGREKLTVKLELSQSNER